MINRDQTRLICQHYLALLYKNSRGGGIHTRQKENIAETYGEILYESVNKLFSFYSPHKQDIFIDFGSGLGKLVIQTFLNTEAKQVIGIEIIPELHQQSLFAATRVQAELPEFFAENRKLTFLLGDFFDFSFDTATIALISSPCFDQHMLHKLGNLINDTPSIHTVFSLRPITTLTRLTFKRTIRIEGSWDTALCYVYR